MLDVPAHLKLQVWRRWDSSRCSCQRSSRGNSEVATYLEVRRWDWNEPVKCESEVKQGGDTKSPKSWWKCHVPTGTRSKMLQILSSSAHLWFHHGRGHKPTVKGMKNSRIYFCEVTFRKLWPEFNQSTDKAGSRIVRKPSNPTKSKGAVKSADKCLNLCITCICKLVYLIIHFISQS